GVPSLASYPAGFPSQYTVAASSTSPNRTEPAAAPVGAVAGDTSYDITVTGPNRFLRRFTGDTAEAGAKLSVRPEDSPQGFGAAPRLVLTLANDGAAAVTFTITTNAYGHDKPRTYHVPAGQNTVHATDPLAAVGGWYDVTVTASNDASW